MGGCRCQAGSPWRTGELKLIPRGARSLLHLPPYCGVEQMVARRAHNPKAAGSSPAPATRESPVELAGLSSSQAVPHSVYALYSASYDKLYVGETSDLPDRFKSHNELATKGWTVRYRPWSLLYSEECVDRTEARKREKQLKSGRGREFLRSLLR